MPANGRGAKHTSYVAVTVTKLRPVKAGELRECDLEESFQKGHGKGGQHQNTTDSAVRLRHKPSGLEVFINGRKQVVNRQTARECMASKVAAWSKNQQTRADYGGAGRGQKVRTYKLSDSLIVDHRNGARCHRPSLVLEEGRFELLRG